MQKRLPPDEDPEPPIGIVLRLDRVKLPQIGALHHTNDQPTIPPHKSESVVDLSS